MAHTKVQQKNNRSLVSIILGIISPFAFVLFGAGIIIAIIGLIFGITSKDKKKKIGIIINSLSLIIQLTILVTGLVFIINSINGFLNKDRLLNETALEAKTYMEEKYDRAFEIQESGKVQTNSLLFPSYSNDQYIIFTDGTKVLFSDEDNMYYDDYQANAISKVIINEIWNPMLEKISPYRTLNNAFANFNFYNEEGLQGNFFHEYYDGSDIASYLEKEQINVDFGYFDEYGNWRYSNLYLISEDENSWQERFEIINKTSKLDKKSVRFVALTTLLFEQEVIDLEKGSHGSYYINPDNTDDCWAIMWNGKIKTKESEL